jgi:hypothetical protein
MKKTYLTDMKMHIHLQEILIGVDMNLRFAASIPYKLRCCIVSDTNSQGWWQWMEELGQGLSLRMCGEKECTIYVWKEMKLFVPFAPFFPKGKNLVTKLNFSPIQIHKDRLRRGFSFLPLHLLVTILYQYSWILNVYFKKILSISY